jgi:hypothetical protein
MDYPQLNLIFGLILIFTLTAGIGLRVLLSKLDLPVWMSVLSWTALALSIFSAIYIEILFLRLMIPAFNRQIVLSLLLIGGVIALATAILYRREIPPRAAGFLFGMQMLANLVCLVLAFGLYRSLVPVPGVN